MVSKLDGLLYQPLAEGAPSDNGASVVVLDGTRQNLGGGGRALVDEYYEWNVLIGAAPVAAILLSGRLASLRIDDEAVFGQKLVGYLDSRLEIATRIAAQVDSEVLESLLG